jgi:hypothetical protein
MAGSEFDVQEKHHFYDVGGIKSYHSGDEYQEYRIMLDNTEIASIQNSHAIVYRDFWATIKHVYSLKYLRKFDNENKYVGRSILITRFDQQGKERVCIDVTEYQDKTNSLMFSSIISEETFVLCSWVTGNMERIEISVNDCTEGP